MTRPCSSARSCSSFSRSFERAGRQLRQAQQRADAISIEADVTPGAGEIALAVERSRRAVAVPGNRRAAEIQRPPGASLTTFTTLGLSSSATDSIGAASVAMSAVGVRLQCLGHLADERGRHERLIALHVHHDLLGAQPRTRATSAMRSVPEAWARAVSCAAAPKACAALMIRSSSVAISTSARPRCAGTLVHPLQHRLAGDRRAAPCRADVRRRSVLV